MKKPAVARGCASLAILLFLAGCAGNPSAQPTDSPPPTSPSTPAQAANGAPSPGSTPAFQVASAPAPSAPSVSGPAGPGASPPADRPQSAAATAVDYGWRPSPDYAYAWQKDEAAGVGLSTPAGEGGWWVYDSGKPLPGVSGSDLRFVQWRGKTIMDKWAVYAQVLRNGRVTYTSSRLGDEFAWYQTVSRPGEEGFALVVGTLNHGGQREWRAGVAVLPYLGGFGEAQLLTPGYLGGSMVSADQSHVLVWAGQFADAGEDGVIINCLLCNQHMTVTPYSWRGWKLVQGQPYRSRLMYSAGSAGAALEKPVLPQAMQAYNEGLKLVDAGKLPEARERFAAALKLDPTFADAANELGYTYITTGDWAAALEPLQTALKIDQLHPFAQYNMALALFKLGRYQEAREHAAYAATLERDRPEPKALLDQIRSAMPSKG